jgi:hypothetical protein
MANVSTDRQFRLFLEFGHSTSNCVAHALACSGELQFAVGQAISPV